MCHTERKTTQKTEDTTMKKSEEIRNELEALKAEREAKIKAMVCENP